MNENISVWPTFLSICNPGIIVLPLNTDGLLLFFLDGSLYIALKYIQGTLDGSSQLFSIIPRTSQYIEIFDKLLKTTCLRFNQIKCK